MVLIAQYVMSIAGINGLKHYLVNRVIINAFEKLTQSKFVIVNAFKSLMRSKFLIINAFKLMLSKFNIVNTFQS